MDDKHVRDLVKEEIDAALDRFDGKIMYYFDRVFGEIGKVEKKLSKQISTVNKELKNVRDELLTMKAAVVNIENTLKGYGDMYTLNSEKIDSLDYRVTKLEKKAPDMVLHEE